MLDAFTSPLLQSALRASPLLILRHARARSRGSWRSEDSARPLTATGRRQADALVPVLQAYGVQRVLTSDSVRCAATVRPYGREAMIELECDHRLSEDRADPAQGGGVVRRLLRTTRPAVVCSHRLLLPELFAAIGVADPHLDPGGFVVVHHRGNRVHATEQHAV